MEKIQEFFSKLSSQDKAIIGVISIFVIGGIGFAALLFLGGDDDEPVILEDSERENIIAEVIKNNPGSILEDIAEDTVQNQIANNIESLQNLNTNQENPIDTEEELADVIDETGRSIQSETNNPPMGSNGPDYIKLFEDDSEHNYSVSTKEITFGPASESCSYDYVYQYFKPDSVDSMTKKYYDVFQTQRRYFYKSETVYDGSDNQYVTISRNDFLENQNITYNSGEYALKINYPVYLQDYFPPSYPNSYPNSFAAGTVSYPVSGTVLSGNVLDQFSYYFGSNAVIESNVLRGGQEFYVIVNEYSALCNWDPALETLEQPSDRFINVYYVNADTFEIEHEEQYLNERDEDYLIFEADYTIEKSLVNVNDVLDTFEFEEDINFVEISTGFGPSASREEYLDASIEYIIENDIDFVVPSNDHYTPRYLFNQTLICYTEYCERRNNPLFYSDDEIGQSLYQRAIRYYSSSDYSANPSFYIYYGNNHHGFSHSIYTNTFESQDSLELVRSHFLFGNRFYPDWEVAYNLEKLEGRSIILDGQSVSVTMYDVETANNYYKWRVSYPGSYPSSYTISWPVSYDDGYVCYAAFCYSQNGVIFTQGQDNYNSINYHGSNERYLTEEVTYRTLDASNASHQQEIRQILENTAGYWW